MCLEMRDQEMGIFKMTLDKWCPDTDVVGVSWYWSLHGLIRDMTKWVGSRGLCGSTMSLRWTEYEGLYRAKLSTSQFFAASESQTFKALLFKWWRCHLETDLFPHFLMLSLEIIAYLQGCGKNSRESLIQFPLSFLMVATWTEPLQLKKQQINMKQNVS